MKNETIICRKETISVIWPLDTAHRYCNGHSRPSNEGRWQRQLWEDRLQVARSKITQYRKTRIVSELSPDLLRNGGERVTISQPSQDGRFIHRLQLPMARRFPLNLLCHSLLHRLDKAPTVCQGHCRQDHHLLHPSPDHNLTTPFAEILLIGTGVPVGE